MPRYSVFDIVLTAEERGALEATARKYTSPYRDVVRAKVVLLAAEGLQNIEIARRLDLPRQIVSKWRKRFVEERLEGLQELPRGGRPSTFPPQVVVEVKALACQLLQELGLPVSRLSCQDIARETVRRAIVASISGATVWRWLSQDAIRPWCCRSWIRPVAPNFASIAGRVLDLYARAWEGKPLKDSVFVVSTDEKTTMQARRRMVATRAPQPGRPGRVEHEYQRRGALAYLAA